MRLIEKNTRKENSKIIGSFIHYLLTFIFKIWTQTNFEQILQFK